jgi:hypothetical protein
MTRTKYILSFAAWLMVAGVSGDEAADKAKKAAKKYVKQGSIRP